MHVIVVGGATDLDTSAHWR